MSNTFKEVVNIFSTKYNSCFKSKYVEYCLLKENYVDIEIPFIFAHCCVILDLHSKGAALKVVRMITEMFSLFLSISYFHPI